MSERKYHHGNLRKSLLEAGLLELEKVGPEELSLRELARQVGVSPNAPYRHFATKEDLLQAMIESGFQLMAERFGQVRAIDPSDIHAMGDAYLVMAKQHPQLMRLMFAPCAAMPESDVFPQDGPMNAWQMLVDTARRRLGKAEVDDDVIRTTTALWALVHGLQELNRMGIFDHPAIGGTPVGRFHELLRQV